MANNQHNQLKITTEQGDTFSLVLSPLYHPITFETKKRELVASGLSETDAENSILITPIPMELFYASDQGCFAVEAEGLADIEIFNPYTGQKIPNENLDIPEQNEKFMLGDITGRLEAIKDELIEIHISDKLTIDGEFVLENVVSHLEDCLGEIHKFTDPVDQKGLFHE